MEREHQWHSDCFQNRGKDRFIDLRNQLLLISLVTLLVSVLGAAVISGTVTRPILTPGTATQRISQGTIQRASPLSPIPTAEIPTSPGSIESMQEVIAQGSRELSIKPTMTH